MDHVYYKLVVEFSNSLFITHSGMFHALAVVPIVIGVGSKFEV